jgi:hypothetical protein
VKMQSAITPAHADISANARKLRYLIPLLQTRFNAVPSQVDDNCNLTSDALGLHAR